MRKCKLKEKNKKRNKKNQTQSPTKSPKKETNKNLKNSMDDAVQDDYKTFCSNESKSSARSNKRAPLNRVIGQRGKVSAFKTKKKLSKDQLRRAKSHKIPKPVLEQALEMLKDENHEVWHEKNISCLSPISVYYEDYRALKMKVPTIKLRRARECLLRRDWKNLCRIITMFITEDNDMFFYSIFAKYAAIYLAYNDLEQFKHFMQTHNVTDENYIIRICTTIKQSLNN